MDEVLLALLQRSHNNTNFLPFYDAVLYDAVPTSLLLESTPIRGSIVMYAAWFISPILMVALCMISVKQSLQHRFWGTEKPSPLFHRFRGCYEFPALEKWVVSDIVPILLLVQLSLYLIPIDLSYFTSLICPFRGQTAAPLVMIWSLFFVAMLAHIFLPDRPYKANFLKFKDLVVHIRCSTSVLKTTKFKVHMYLCIPRHT